MKISSLATLFPAMTDEEYNNLVESIENYGLLEPITTYNGEIIDGRHRYDVCTEEAAEVMGVSVSSVERAKKVKREDPALHERIKAGTDDSVREPVDMSDTAIMLRLRKRVDKEGVSVQKSLLYHLAHRYSSPLGSWAKVVPNDPKSDPEFTKMVCKWRLSKLHPDKGGNNEEFIEMKSFTNTVLKEIK